MPSYKTADTVGGGVWKKLLRIAYRAPKGKHHISPSCLVFPKGHNKQGGDYYCSQVPVNIFFDEIVYSTFCVWSYTISRG